MNERQRAFYDKTKIIAEKKGWLLLSLCYFNNLQDMEFQCKKGHRFWRCYTVLQKESNECNECRTLKYKEDFKAYVIEKGWELLSEYINSYTDVILKCPFGHFKQTTPAKFKRSFSRITSVGCAVCAGNSKSEAERTYREEAARREFTVVGEYINNETPTDMLCPYKHPCRITPTHFKACNGCKTCNDSYMEAETRLIFKTYNINHIRNFQIKDLLNKLYDFQFGFMDKNVLLELDGKQHFKYIKLFCPTLEEYINRQNADRIKHLCASTFGYLVIRIDYTNEKNILFHLIKALEAFRSGAQVYFSRPELYKYLEEPIPVDYMIKHCPKLADLYGHCKIEYIPNYT